MKTKPIVVANESEVIEGRVLTVDVGAKSIALCRVQGTVCAFANRCTHEDWSLHDAYLVDGRVVCSLHGAAFDAKSGECVRGPAADALATYAVEVRGGDVLLTLDESEE